MAEGTSPNQDSMVCSTLINSPPEESRPVSNNSMSRPKNCVYFQSGTCRFGTRCHFPHVLNPVDPTSSVQSNGRSIGPPVQLPSNATMPKLKKTEAKNESLPSENLNEKEAKVKSNPPNWVHAPEFVPRMPLPTYASAARVSCPFYEPPRNVWMDLCIDFMMGRCKLDSCPYVHGETCEICGLAILNPFNEEQSKEHTEACEKEMVRDMELSFAVQQSIDKACSICFECIMEKTPPSERRFGILDNCSHVFCLACIRRWRSQRQNANENDLDNGPSPNSVRTCPACRVSSDFIIPSRYWVETKEEKQKLISDYKDALSKKHCKYFNRGADNCPFGGYCFYLHELPNGIKVDLPKPERRRRQNQNGELDLVGNVTLWEFMEYRSDSLLRIDDHIYTVTSFSDTDSSESSGRS